MMNEMMNSVKKEIFILAIFILQVFASSCPFGQKMVGGQCVNDYLINLANVLVVVFLTISGIVYMIGNVFASPRVIEYSKALLKITLQNVFILFIIYFLLSWLDTVGSVFATSSLAYPGERISRDFGQWSGMQDYIESYLMGLKNSLETGLRFIFTISVMAGLFSALQFMLSLSSLGLTGQFMVPLGSGFSSLVNFLSYGVTLLVAVIINVELQYQIFTIIGKNIFPLLLPFGIMLRTFPLTRGAGSALLAIAIGFGIFLPIAYLIGRDIGDKVCGGDLSFDPGELVTRLMGKLRDPGMFVNYLNERLQPGGFFWKILCKYGIEAFILPFFGYIMILNLIRHLAEIMGTHIDLSTLVRII